MQPTRYPGASPLDSEDDAWAFLDWLQAQPEGSLVESGLLTPPAWAEFNLHYAGSRYNATITAPMMEALLTLQSAVYRSYALLKYNDEKASRLSDQDKENTSISIEVRSGTTGLNFDATDVAKHFIDVVGSKMTGVEDLAVCITAIVLFFGQSGLKLALNHRAKIKLAQLENDDKADQRRHQSEEDQRKYRAAERAESVREAIALSAEETKRMEILAKLTSKHPRTAIVQNETDKLLDATLRSVDRDEKIDIQGISVSGPVASDIITNPRSSAERINIKDSFQIVSVDGSVSSGFRARLRNIKNDDTFNASLKDTFLSEKEGETVQAAFWQKKLVYLELDARLLRGQIKEAEITKARILEQSVPEATT